MATPTGEHVSHDEAELEILRAWYRYNSYVRKKYLAALEKLPVDELAKTRGASYPSVLDIFVHVLDSYRAWFKFRYEGKEWDEELRLGGRITSVEDARREEQKVDADVLGLLDRLSPEDLQRKIRFPDRGRILLDILRDILWHMVEEELQHRGELNALLWQSGAEPPITDWLVWKFETGQPGPAIL
jgi:uncharacterized damage-inducible protein DinB